MYYDKKLLDESLEKLLNRPGSNFDSFKYLIRDRKISKILEK